MIFGSNMLKKAF